MNNPSAALTALIGRAQARVTYWAQVIACTPNHDLEALKWAEGKRAQAARHLARLECMRDAPR